MLFGTVSGHGFSRAEPHHLILEINPRGEATIKGYGTYPISRAGRWNNRQPSNCRQSGNNVIAGLKNICEEQYLFDQDFVSPGAPHLGLEDCGGRGTALYLTAYGELHEEDGLYYWTRSGTRWTEVDGNGLD
jgi:hypothetical protein